MPYKDKSKRRAFTRRWYKANRERLRAAAAARRKQNRLKRNARARELYAQNRDARTTYARAWISARPEKRRQYQKRYYAKNKEALLRKGRANYARMQTLGIRYGRGIPKATRKPPGACEICGRTPDRALALDHCHKTGQFRGWLCGQCNTALGMFQDSPTVMRSAIAYLRRAA